MVKLLLYILKAIIFLFTFIVYCYVSLLKFLFNLIFKKNNYTKNRRSLSLSEIDSLDGLAFERFIADLLKKLEFKSITVTKASGDFGVDIIAFKDKKKWVFQCKRYKSKLSIKPIQEIYSGARKYNADIAVVVTNAYFTNCAKEFAADLSVLLWDRDILAKLIGSSNVHSLLSQDLVMTANKIDHRRI